MSKKKDEIKEETKDEVKLESASEDKITIEALKNEIYELKNKYAMAYADTENLKKRLQSEAETLRKYRSQQFLLDVLPVLDNFERALYLYKDKDDSFYTGIKMIYEQFMETLKKEGAEEIKCLNEQFDPSKEQAVFREDNDDVEENTVLEVLQKGYMLKDRVLRPAMVKVSKKTEEKKEEITEENNEEITEEKKEGE